MSLSSLRRLRDSYRREVALDRRRPADIEVQYLINLFLLANATGISQLSLAGDPPQPPNH